MDGNTISLLVVIALVVLTGVGIYRYRQNSKVRITGPLGTGIEYEGSNVPPAHQPAIRGEGIQSRKGGLTADSETGAIQVKDVDVERDVLLKTRKSEGSENPNI